MAVRHLSYERSSETDVILVLQGGKANRDFVRLVVEENQAGRPFRLDDLLLLNQLWRDGHLAVSEAAFVLCSHLQETGPGSSHMCDSEALNRFKQSRWLANGKITRKQAAELCKISSTQACDLLSRLVKKGILEMHGSKKGDYYKDASKNMDESK